jgi:electron transfer flavoprotein alpha subunit
MILVFVEHDQGQADRSSLEALSAARRVASAAGAAEPVAAVLIGPGAAVGAASLAGYGVAEAHVVEDERLSAYAPAGWGRTVAQLAASLAPTIVLAAGTDRGHEVLAYAAAMSEAPMAANCLEIRPGSPFEVTRQRWGGSLLEEAALDGSAAAGAARFLTVAEHAFQPESASASSAVAVHSFAPTLSEADLRVRVVSKVAPEAGVVSLADARVVVGGGRGVGGAEAFSELEELAGLLHGAVGVSRVVTSAGWRPHSQQVGQTGTRIAPDIYIACGISGAIQHIVGCKAAKSILVINTDREAPIMSRAAYAVIGDLHTVVPAISAEIRRRQAS